MSKVAVIRTSPHRNGNSNIFADKFIEGAQEAGNEIIDINLNDYKINYCMGCYGTNSPNACTATKKCWQNDDMNTLCNIVRECDVLVYATPVYYYSISGQMKVFLDRTVQFYGTTFAYRDVYLIASCEAKRESAVEGAIKALQGWIDCMPETKLAGVIYGIGVLAPGEASESKNVLEKAKEMGRSIR